MTMRLIDSDEIRIKQEYMHVICDSVMIRVEDVARIITEMPTIDSQPQWIPCCERLPKEEKKTYWVCTDDGYQCECRWTNVNMIWTHLTNDWHWNILDIPQHSKVTAWMPLPEPYKELYKEEEEE